MTPTLPPDIHPRLAKCLKPRQDGFWDAMDERYKPWVVFCLKDPNGCVVGMNTLGKLETFDKDGGVCSYSSSDVVLIPWPEPKREPRRGWILVRDGDSIGDTTKKIAEQKASWLNDGMSAKIRAIEVVELVKEGE